jgi:hypothetical protein
MPTEQKVAFITNAADARDPAGPPGTRTDAAQKQ